MDKKRISESEAKTSIDEHFGEGSILGFYERKILRLRNLIDVAKIINSTLEKESLYQSILLSCQGEFCIQNVSIFISDSKNDSVYYMESTVGSTYNLEQITISISDPIISLLTADISYIQIASLNKSKYKLLHEINKHLEGELIFPLKVKNKLNGFIILGKKLDGSDFIYEDLFYIRIFSEFVATAVENMNLFELVTLDRMTKLYNHHYFHTRLQEEVNRAKRYNHELTVILADIDFFKNINDFYGHIEGDKVIIQFAKHLQASFRNTDIIARYGGEEFAIILPETSINETNSLLVKIKESVSNITFTTKNNEKFNITASFGISTLEKGVAENEYDLLCLADRALYRSKADGRNKITFYNEILP
ncbi:MAG: sensor domain-containing diguanylate cyclase [Spirochaetota bacterium]|nr:sensor domain-containing diguanylate cyclase [Spirochaetota bacterium]